MLGVLLAGGGAGTGLGDLSGLDTDQVENLAGDVFGLLPGPVDVKRDGGATEIVHVSGASRHSEWNGQDDGAEDVAPPRPTAGRDRSSSFTSS